MTTKRGRRRDDEDEEDRPRRRRDDDGDDPPARRRPAKRKKSGNGVKAAAVIVGGVLGCVALLAVILAATGGRKSDEENKVTPGRVGAQIENSAYATPAGIQKELGSGRVVGQDEWSRIRLTRGAGADAEDRSLAGWIGHYQGKPVPTVYHWAGKDEDLYVAFWPTPERTSMAPHRTAVTHYHAPGEKPSVLTGTGY